MITPYNTKTARSSSRGQDNTVGTSFSRERDNRDPWISREDRPQMHRVGGIL